MRHISSTDNSAIASLQAKIKETWGKTQVYIVLNLVYLIICMDRQSITYNSTYTLFTDKNGKMLRITVFFLCVYIRTHYKNDNFLTVGI